MKIVSKSRGPKRAPGIASHSVSASTGPAVQRTVSTRRIMTASVNPQKEIIPEYNNLETVLQNVGSVSWSSIYESLEKRWAMYELLGTIEEGQDQTTNSAVTDLVKVRNESAWDDKVSFALMFAALCDIRENLRCDHKMEQWFTLAEMRIFSARIETLPLEALSSFLVQFGYHPQTITAEEDEYLRHQNYMAGPFLKVPFYEAGRYLSRRRLLLMEGHAFIRKSEVVDMVLMRNRENLQQRIRENAMSPAWDRLPQEIHPMMQYYREMVHKKAGYRLKEGGYHTESCTSSYVKQEAVEMFPPCMHFVYREFMKRGHLKHFGRLQLIIFLKGVGLSYAEATKFFSEREPLTKDYVYQLKHAYGEEGSRTNYSPYGCANLLKAMRNAGDVNGCLMCKRQFKMEDIETNLDNMLITKGFDEVQRADILNDVIPFVESNQPTHACTRFLYRSMKKEYDEEYSDINHPNSYFSRARRLVNSKNRESLEKLISELEVSDLVTKDPTIKKETPMEEELNENEEPSVDPVIKKE